MSLKIIGAGFGRTGTDSMRLALNMLGFGPTHHMLEINGVPEQEKRWLGLAGGDPADWDALFEGYSSCVDWPSAFYWQDLIGYYPDAKVLLTWRDPESWWTSFENTILKVIRLSDDPDTLGQRLIAEQVFGGKPGDREHVLAIYRDHIDEVIATVPENRLLVHRIGDGWAPLCAFLGVAVPKEDYPRTNAGKRFFDNLTGTYKE